jgi:hypothetical protein
LQRADGRERKQTWQLPDICRFQIKKEIDEILTKKGRNKYKDVNRCSSEEL